MRHDVTNPRPRLPVIATAGLLLCAVWAPASAAEVTVEAPPGFTVSPTEPGSDGVSIVEISRTWDDAGCEVAFRAVKPSASRSQAAINADVAKPDFLASLKQREGAKFDRADYTRFKAGDVQGGAILGVPVGSNGAVRELLVVLDMPEGRTLVSCSADTAQFDALRPAFETVARSVKPPKG